MPTTVTLDGRELATILHGLRMIQCEGRMQGCLAGDCEHFDDCDALSNEEIDELCERVNCSPDSRETKSPINQEQNDAFVAAAKRIHQEEGELEVDYGAVVSYSDDGGAYVAAWVWVSNDEVESKYRYNEQEDESAWTNHYYHHGQQWDSEWSCQCNDECPVCHHEIEPYASTDNATGDLQIHNQTVNDLAEAGGPCCEVCGDALCTEHKKVDA